MDKELEDCVNPMKKPDKSTGLGGEYLMSDYLIRKSGWGGGVMLCRFISNWQNRGYFVIVQKDNIGNYIKVKCNIPRILSRLRARYVKKLISHSSRPDIMTCD